MGLYKNLRIYLGQVKRKYLVRRVLSLRYALQEKKCKEKDKIRVTFFALFDSTWKCDIVYQKMLDDERFDPVILICPVVNFGYENMRVRMAECASFFDSKGYKYILSYDSHTNKYVSIESLKTDVIFFTNPYVGLIDDRYNIFKCSNILTIYLPYSITTASCYQENFNLDMMNRVWRFYVESNMHKGFAEKYSYSKGKNAVVTGHPCIEEYLDDKYVPKDNWKIKDRKFKRIIWAPHHTIKPVFNLDFSCFLKYAEYFRMLAVKYQDSIQIAFKPHPLLKNKLIDLWGKDKTDEYYKWWDNNPNTILSEGEYRDLFLTSDAMIHDSGSFVTEYLYINKPVMRTLTGTDYTSMFNDFGIACINQHYLGNNEDDIKNFVQNVIAEIDPMKEPRTKFLNEVLIPRNGMPSDNIIKDIIDSLLKK